MDNLSVDDLFDSIIQPLAREYGATTENEFLPFHEWVAQSSLIVDGAAFTYRKHEYLLDVYQDNHPFTVDMKAAQMGLTVRAMLRVIHNARYRAFRGQLYFFPSRTDVTDFTKARMDPLIEENPDNIAQWIRDTDSANIKRIWNCFIYFRGMKSRVGLKSAPGDCIVYDELDEAPQNAVDMADERMSHSAYKEKMMLSNPTLPDYGIHKHFLLSDQKYWLLKCEHCNQFNDLVADFPNCLLEVHGKVIRACRKCKKELNPAVGEWVAVKPSVRERSGRQYSQLWSQFVDPAAILHIFKTTPNLRDLYNLKIGVPYIEAENRLSIQEVLALCGQNGIASSDTDPCFMGVDQGKGLHVVIGKDRFDDIDMRHLTERISRLDEAGYSPAEIAKEALDRNAKIIHLGIYRDWEELDGLMKNFNITRCVVDAQPEMRNARAFAGRFKGRVFLNFYKEFQKGHYKWDEEDLTVACNRTESLDASHNEIKFAQIILPHECDIVRTFAEHLHNVGKKLEEDEESGSKRYVYVKLGEDHFRHAYNYECMARQHASGLLYPELL